MTDDYTQRIRVLVTIDKLHIGQESLLISHSRFVYGFDSAVLFTVEDILRELRTKLIPSSCSEKYQLELILGNETEYFIPPWSKARDVLQNGDQVILRLRRRAIAEETGEKLNEGAVEPNKKDKKKRKRKRDDECAASVLSTAPNDGELNAVNKISEGHVSGVTVSKKSKKQRPTVTHTGEQDGARGGEEIPREDNDSSNVDLNNDSLSKDHSQKKKRRKKGNADSLYDNAIVIRNGDTGKIQHVYFDSSSPSPVSEEKTKEDSVKSTPQSPASKKKTKKFTNKALAKAKEFTTMIDHTTTCDSLAKVLHRTIAAPQMELVDLEQSSDSVPIVITKKPQTRRIVDENGDGYRNASFVMKKAVNSTSAGSTPSAASNLSMDETHFPCPTTHSKLVSNGHTFSSQYLNVACSSNRSLRIEPDAPSQNSTPMIAAVVNSKLTRPIEEYPVIKHAGSLRIGDCVAYKVMELNELDCTPGISDWKLGELVDLNVADMELRIKLVSGEARCEVPRKFRLVSDDEIEEEENDAGARKQLEQEQDQEDIVNWNELIDPRLITS